RLGESHVGELGRVGDHVAHGEDVSIGGALGAIGDDEVPIVYLDFGALTEQVLTAWSTSDRHDDHVNLDVVAALDADGGAALLGTVTRHRHAGANIDTALLEGAANHADHFGVTTGEDRGQELEHGHLGAHIAEHRGDLAPDGAPADHGRGRRQRGEVQELIGRHHDRAVDVET